MIADSVAFKLSNKYREYCKDSHSPIKPHFNMNTVNGDILNYLFDNKLDSSVEDILDKIELLNTSLGDKYNNTRQNKDIIKRISKIQKYTTKCYLFVESDNFTDKLD